MILGFSFKDEENYVILYSFHFVFPKTGGEFAATADCEGGGCSLRGEE